MANDVLGARICLDEKQRNDGSGGMFPSWEVSSARMRFPTDVATHVGLLSIKHDRNVRFN